MHSTSSPPSQRPTSSLQQVRAEVRQRVQQEFASSLPLACSVPPSSRPTHQREAKKRKLEQGYAHVDDESEAHDEAHDDEEDDEDEDGSDDCLLSEDGSRGAGSGSGSGSASRSNRSRTSPTTTGLPAPVAKLERRKQQNRNAAANSREKKRLELEGLRKRATEAENKLQRAHRLIEDLKQQLAKANATIAESNTPLTAPASPVTPHTAEHIELMPAFESTQAHSSTPSSPRSYSSASSSSFLTDPSDSSFESGLSSPPFSSLHVPFLTLPRVDVCAPTRPSKLSVSLSTGVRGVASAEQVSLALLASPVAPKAEMHMDFAFDSTLAFVPAATSTFPSLASTHAPLSFTNAPNVMSESRPAVSDLRSAALLLMSISLLAQQWLRTCISTSVVERAQASSMTQEWTVGSKQAHTRRRSTLADHSSPHTSMDGKHQHHQQQYNMFSTDRRSTQRQCSRSQTYCFNTARVQLIACT